MPFGLPLGTMIASWLVAKITGSVPFMPASVSFFMLTSSAEANTSAGAPCGDLFTSADEPSKLKVALASGFAL